jgi:hypothetical protein
MTKPRLTPCNGQTRHFVDKEIQTPLLRQSGHYFCDCFQNEVFCCPGQRSNDVENSACSDDVVTTQWPEEAT